MTAIILAAGFGMRMVPINHDIPKALIEVNGEVMIERTIKHLNSSGVKKIYIVVGFMKEKFGYLIEKYDVELIVNDSYVTTNNIYSLKIALDKIAIDDTYILPCDIWSDINPFSNRELNSWYMIGRAIDKEMVIVNEKKEILRAKNRSLNKIIGIAYLTRKDMLHLKSKINYICEMNSDYFWEEALYEKNKMYISPRIVDDTEFIDINTYEDLRRLDIYSKNLKSYVIELISDKLEVDKNSIRDITVLKKGMTNKSFLFTCNSEKYIMRVPGEGTQLLINRQQEYDVYMKIDGMGLCDSPIYISKINGYKITKYIYGVRTCDAYNDDDVKKCMKKLRYFHNMQIKVEHEFDIYERIDFYESLRGDRKSEYKDYYKTKNNVFSLREYINKHVSKKVLAHIDAVADNFLFYDDENKEQLQLIDWEYAAMQDPHIDIAMFCIYSLFEKDRIDEVIKMYFEDNCPNEIRIKIYCYIAVCGLLWSNWCEYKKQLGIEFGDYAKYQYNYAKKYYKYAIEEMKKL